LLISNISFSQSKLATFRTSNQSSFPRYGVEAGGNLFFTAGNTQENNIKIWKTDGSNEGTSEVFTANGINPAGPFPQFSNTEAVKPFGNKVLIIGSVSIQNQDQELWVSDGTALGTFRLADINPGNGSSGISNVKVLSIGGQDIAFFSANDGINGQELWKTDGTVAGTVMVKNINDGGGSSNPGGFVQLNNKILFFANNGIHGNEPWVSDGTENGTFLLKDINPGIANSANIFEVPPESLNGIGYFQAYNSFNIPELWQSDGTVDGTFSVGGSSYQYPRNFKIFDNKLYFTINNTFTNLLYIDNSSPFPLFVNYFEFGSSVLNARDFTVSGDKLFFTSTFTNGECRLYYVLTGVGFASLAYSTKDINPSVNNDPFPSDLPKRKFYPIANGGIVFLADNLVNGYELWYSNGTFFGTFLLRDHVSGSLSGDYSYIKTLGNMLYYIVDDQNGNYDAWQGTINTNTLSYSAVAMNSINPSLGLSNFYPIASMGGQLYFSAYDQNIGYELYKTDGINISLVKDIYTNENHDNPQTFSQTAKIGNTLYFTADNGKNGLEIWKTNGKISGTSMAFEINKYPAKENITGYNIYFDHYNTSTLFYKLFSDDSKLYFAENNSIWVYDGVNTPIKLLSLNNSFNFSTEFAILNGLVYFVNSSKLYKTDGTVAGTELIGLIDNNLPNDSRSIQGLINFDNKLFFKGYHSVYGEEIFYSNGTVGDINLLADLITGNNSYSFNEPKFKKVGSTLFFTHFDPSQGCKLYKTDGNSASTTLLKNFGLNGSCPSYLTNYKEQLLGFQGYDDTFGYELWKSDGTVLGTQMVKDINPSSSSYPLNLGKKFEYAYYNDFLYFSANDGNQTGIFKSNLTNAGTSKIINSNGSYLLDTDFGIYFATSSPLYGQEPFKMESDSASIRLISDIISGINGSNPSIFLEHQGNLYFRTLNANGKYEIHVFKDCPNDYIINSPLVSNNTFEALDKIKISTDILSDTKQIFFARNNVELLPGFKTNQNVVINAQIRGCIADINGN